MKHLVEVETIDISELPVQLPWWILIILVALAGAFGMMSGILFLHTADPFGDRSRIEHQRDELLRSAPYWPYKKDEEGWRTSRPREES